MAFGSGIGAKIWPREAAHDFARYRAKTCGGTVSSETPLFSTVKLHQNLQNIVCVMRNHSSGHIGLGCPIYVLKNQERALKNSKNVYSATELVPVWESGPALNLYGPPSLA